MNYHAGTHQPRIFGINGGLTSAEVDITADVVHSPQTTPRVMSYGTVPSRVPPLRKTDTDSVVTSRCLCCTRNLQRGMGPRLAFSSRCGHMAHPWHVVMVRQASG